jgi:hypothetical protein
MDNYFPGDLIYFNVMINGTKLLEGPGLIIEKADPDSETILDGWIVFSKDKFWFIRETHMEKLDGTRRSSNISALWSP